MQVQFCFIYWSFLSATICVFFPLPGDSLCQVAFVAERGSQFYLFWCFGVHMKRFFFVSLFHCLAVLALAMVFLSSVPARCSFTGYDGPWCHKKKWYSVAADAPVAAHLTWGACVKWFLLLWKSYLKGNKVTIPQKVARPCSASVAKWLVCYRLRWTKPQVDEVDAIVFAQLRRQVVTAKDVALLTAAKTVWARTKSGSRGRSAASWPPK